MRAQAHASRATPQDSTAACRLWGAWPGSQIVVFERFTEPARRVVVLGREEARALGHAHIGTEHLLLGLLREDEGVAARALDALGLSVQESPTQLATDLRLIVSPKD